MGCRQSTKLSSILPDVVINSNEDSIENHKKGSQNGNTNKTQTNRSTLKLNADTKDTNEVIEENHIVDESGLLFMDAVNNQNNFMAAVKRGDFDTVLLLIGIGIDINSLGMWSSTPLIVACQYGHTPIALEILKAENVNVNHSNEKGATALLYSCLEGSTDVVTCLISLGSKVDIAPAMVYNSMTDKTEPNTPFSAAIINGHIEVLKLLITAGCDPNEIIPVNRIKGSLTVAKSPDSGLSPLQLACSYGHIDIISYLISSGADHLKKDIENATILHHACRYNKHGNVLLEYLFTVCDFNTDFLQTADCNGDTILHIACSTKQSPTLITTLLERKCNPNTQNNLGLTPLHLAVKSKSENIVTILIQHYASSSISDKKGITAFAMASKLGKDSTIFKLLESNISQADNISQTDITDTAAPTSTKSNQNSEKKSKKEKNEVNSTQNINDDINSNNNNNTNTSSKGTKRFSIFSNKQPVTTPTPVVNINTTKEKSIRKATTTSNKEIQLTSLDNTNQTADSIEDFEINFDGNQDMTNCGLTLGGDDDGVNLTSGGNLDTDFELSF